MATDNCKLFLISKYPDSQETDWKRIKKTKNESLTIRDFENKKNGNIVQVSENTSGKLKIVILPEESSINFSTPVRTKPNFNCVLVATEIQKKEADDYLNEYRNSMHQADFEKLKFVPQNYYFQIGVMSDGEWLKTTLDCNKTISQLTEKEIELFVIISDKGGTWYDGAEENFLSKILCPTIFCAGGSEGTMEACDETLTCNDIVAFLERRGLIYQKESDEIKMKNFRSKVNDTHVWAYPNPDLTPTPTQMWELVKSHMYAFPMYKNYMDKDMIDYYVKNDTNNYHQDIKKDLKNKFK